MSNYVPGAWNAHCSMCGFTFKNFQLRKHWQGRWRCTECWEPRHPQDFAQPTAPEEPPPWTQTLADPIPIGICSPNGMTSIAGVAVAGCCVTGSIHPFFDASITI